MSSIELEGGRLSYLIELTRNHVIVQLIPASDIKEDLQKINPEIANAMKWIHIGAIQLMVKPSLFQGVSSLIDIVMSDNKNQRSQRLCDGKHLKISIRQADYINSLPKDLI